MIIGVRVFHAREQQKVLLRAIVEGTCFCRRDLLSSFFFLNSSFFFFSHPDSYLKNQDFSRKSSVLGEVQGNPGELREEGARHAPRVSTPEREASSARLREHVAQHSQASVGSDPSSLMQLRSPRFPCITTGASTLRAARAEHGRR